MSSSSEKPEVIGIGGVFFRSPDPDKTKDWYRENLGLNTDQYGALFKFREFDNPDQVGHLQWSAFPKDTEYFMSDDQEYMINYRVRNLEALVEQLKQSGVEILDDIATYDYGSFVHVRDGDGRTIELWEPVDQGL